MELLKGLVDGARAWWMEQCPARPLGSISIHWVRRWHIDSTRCRAREKGEHPHQRKHSHVPSDSVSCVETSTSTRGRPARAISMRGSTRLACVLAIGKERRGRGALAHMP